MGALIEDFSTLEGEYCVDGYLFVNRFIAMSQDAKEEKVRKTLN